jgi:hypothetical protein
MAVKRKIDKTRYLIAFGITLLIFIPGLLLGMVLDNERVSALQAQSKIQELDIKSLQLNYLYISNLKNTTNSCIPLKATLEKSIKDLSKSLDKIEEYKKGAKIENNDFNILSRRYLLDNLDYWVLSKKTKELCDLDTVNILYFFNSQCDICPNQGIVLTYFKKKLGDNLLIFPINTDLIDDEPMVSVLVNTYKITEYPSLVIEEKVHLGILNTDEMQQVLCYEYGYNETECSLMI